MTRFNIHNSHIVSYDLLFKDNFINVMQLPKLDNIVVNTGLGTRASNLLTVLLGMETITGRRPIITRARESIDQYKIRKNNPLGCKVTSRSTHSFEWFNRLVSTVLPRLEDIGEYKRIQKDVKIKLNDSRFIPFNTPSMNMDSLVNNKSAFYSISFGLNDFFTSFSLDFDKFQASYGLDITFIIRYSNHSTLSHPFYFLSSFQFFG